MSVESAQPRMSVDEFLVWSDGRTGRWELENGRPIAMAPERIDHVRRKADAYLALRQAISAAGLACEAVADGVAVRVDAWSAYEPDALVYCGTPLVGDTLEVSEPIVVVEVLSPSTAYRDIGAKLAGYFGLPSVSHYLIVDPDKRMLIHHARGTAGVIETRILSDGTLRLDPPGLDLSVGDCLG